jgi:hypothetical protein
LHRTFYHPTNPKPVSENRKEKYLRYTATKLHEAGLGFKAVEPDFSKRSLLDIDFAKDKRLERYPCFNLSWLFSCLPCLKSLRCYESVQCFLRVLQNYIQSGFNIYGRSSFFIFLFLFFLFFCRKRECTQEIFHSYMIVHQGQRDHRTLHLVREKQRQFLIRENIYSLLVSPSEEIEKSKHQCIFANA